jgi:hypothetical protein
MPKTIDPTKKSPSHLSSFSSNQVFYTPNVLFAINGFDGAINGIKSLINWKKTAFAKSNSLQTQKVSYFHRWHQTPKPLMASKNLMSKHSSRTI